MLPFYNYAYSETCVSVIMYTQKYINTDVCNYRNTKLIPSI